MNFMEFYGETVRTARIPLSHAARLYLEKHLILDYVLKGEKCCCGEKRHPDQPCTPEACLDTDRCLALSGTPLETHLGELRALFHVAVPGLLGDGAYSEDVLNRVLWEKPKDAAASAPATDTPVYANKNLSAVDLSGIDVRYVPIGQAKENVGIVAFNVRRYLANKMAFEVFIEVRNFGKDKARRKLVLYAGDSPVEVRTLELEGGKSMQSLYPNISGGTGSRLRAVLVPLLSTSTR